MLLMLVVVVVAAAAAAAVVVTGCTVVPLIQVTLSKGHLSNEGRIIWQQVL